MRQVQLVLTRFFSAYTSTMVSIGITALVALYVTIASGPSPETHLAEAVDFSNVAVGTLFWLGVLLVLVPVVGLPVLRIAYSRRLISESVRTRMIDSVHPAFRSAVRERDAIAYGTVVDVVHHHNLLEGWDPSKVHLRHTFNQFNTPEELLAPDLKDGYRKFYAGHDAEYRLSISERKISWITKIESPFTDSPDLVLESRWSTRSVMLYEQYLFGGDWDALGRVVRDVIINERIEVQSSTSIHCLVVTRDDKLVLLKRSNSVHWYKLHWSPTWDENVSEDDVRAYPKDYLRVCIMRGMKEELGLDPPEEYVIAGEVRILSVFLEGELPAIGLCAYVPLAITFKELESKAAGKIDWESANRKGVALKELRWDTIERPSVPSARYLLMMLMAHRSLPMDQVLPPAFRPS